MNIHVNQIRAARGLLGWSQKELAKRSGVSDVSIINYEKGKRTPHQNTLNRIIQAFELGGVDFTDDGGVRPRQSRIVTYEGREGFIRFFDDIHEVAKSYENPDICVTNVREFLYDRWLGDFEPIHNKRMTSIMDGSKIRALLKEGDKHLTSQDYSEYRWLKAEHFADTSLYLYGEKSAFIDFQDENVKVTVVEDKSVTDSLRKMFDIVWHQSVEY
jgi:transcriptional regulator with XRE-family HTH domain